MSQIRGFFGEYRWLSNFWPSKVVFDDETYPTVENAYQAAKTWDHGIRLLIRNATPGRAKRIGQELRLHPQWENIKLQVMGRLVRQKFYNSVDLCKKLIATGDAELIEENSWGDTFWGVCRGKGSNHLGRILMGIRSELLLAEAESDQQRSPIPQDVGSNPTSETVG